MYADPQTVTINAVAKVMARMPSTSTNVGAFRTVDGEYKLDIKQGSTKRRKNREAVLTFEKPYTDPNSGLTSTVGASVKIVVNEPPMGFTDTELGYCLAGLTAWFSPTNRDRLLGGEI
jgi:hypothetical protein